MKIRRCNGVGSPIRRSPDHRLLASPRGLSQLATSFIASVRQGIHTHALSSLTIKFTQDTVIAAIGFPLASACTLTRFSKPPTASLPVLTATPRRIPIDYRQALHKNLLYICPSIFNFQRSRSIRTVGCLQQPIPTTYSCT